MAHIEAEYQPAANTPEYADMSKLGAGIYRSEDGGETWTVHEPLQPPALLLQPRRDQPVQRQVHLPLQHLASIAPPTAARRSSRPAAAAVVAAAAVAASSTAPQGSGMHCWHAIWLDPHNKKRFWVGSDGGLALTHDDGETYLRFENLNVTQYYDVAADMRDPVLASAAGCRTPAARAVRRRRARPRSTRATGST